MRRKSPTSVDIQTASQSDFSGGLKLDEHELQLTSKHAVIAENMTLGKDSRWGVRQGTRRFVDLAPLITDEMIDGTYFFAYLIVVCRDGTVYAVDATGSATAVWNATIANHIGTTPWGDCSRISFVPMGGKLVVHNGIDKPLIISSDLYCNYLVDEGSQSNFYTPVGHGIKHGNYHVVFFDSTISISHPDTSGTFEGDPAPNYALSKDLGSYVTRGSKTITGCASYRGILLVMFQQCIIPITVDLNTDPAIELTIDDAIDNYGTSSPRTIINLGDDVQFVDISGLSTVSRSVFSKTLTPAHKSDRVAKLLQKKLNALSLSALRDRAFAVYDNNERTYMLFLPNDELEVNTYETLCFMYAFSKDLDKDCWTLAKGWHFHWAARSAEGNIFFGSKDVIYIMGRDDTENIYADFVDEQETFDDDTVFDDGTGLTPTEQGNESGLPINFVWELPWSVMRKRENIKHTKYLSIDTEGDGDFTAKMFLDNIYYAQDQGETFDDDLLFSDDTGFERLEPLLDPALQIDFVGKDAGGYGVAGYGSGPFGGGRTTSNSHLYDWPAKFKFMKLRFDGATRKQLQFTGLSLSYHLGSIRL